MPPALDSALVSLIAETWLNDQGELLAVKAVTVPMHDCSTLEVRCEP